jgi:hypothetical protein
MNSPKGTPSDDRVRPRRLVRRTWASGLLACRPSRTAASALTAAWPGPGRRGQARAAARELPAGVLASAAAPLEHDVPSGVHDVPPGEWERSLTRTLTRAPAIGCASGARICASLIAPISGHVSNLRQSSALPVASHSSMQVIEFPDDSRRAATRRRSSLGRRRSSCPAPGHALVAATVGHAGWRVPAGGQGPGQSDEQVLAATAQAALAAERQTRPGPSPAVPAGWWLSRAWMTTARRLGFVR